jgi:hypothetical protein
MPSKKGKSALKVNNTQLPKVQNQSSVLPPAQRTNQTRTLNKAVIVDESESESSPTPVKAPIKPQKKAIVNNNLSEE